MKQVMNLTMPQENGFCPPRRVRVLGIYQDLADGLKISRLCARSGEELDRTFRTALCSFDVLSLPYAAKMAGVEAGEADVLLVAAKKKQRLPRPVAKLIEAFRLEKPNAIVELCDDEPIEDSTASRQLGKIVYGSRLAAVNSHRRLQEIPDKSAEAAELVSVWAPDGEEVFQAEHCGINE